MSCGASFRERPIRNGSSMPWTGRHAQLLRSMLEIEAETVPDSYGKTFLRCTVSKRLSTRTNIPLTWE
jgi:uracil-DNA glycosylase